MPKITYITKNFAGQSLHLIDGIGRIIDEYSAQGFDLTVRQIYYQFVSRDWLPESWADPDTGSANNLRSYNKIQHLISDARLAGFIDWNAIVDRTRSLEKNSHWDSPKEILGACRKQYEIDKWLTQDYRVEVWIEKDALKGVLETICPGLDVPYFSCRGYTSQSEIWRAAQRLLQYINFNQTPVILYLGDHDPSGVDMTRDIIERLSLFAGESVQVERIALNQDQIETYDPPPNPAKTTDSRAKAYIAEFGYDSWELDALDPQVLVDLVEEAVLRLRDEDRWEEAVAKEMKDKEDLLSIEMTLR